MWKDRILSTFTATMRFIMADNILEVFMDQLSLTMKWKYLHTAAQHTLVALPFISHTFQLRISFKSWQTQESIYQSKSFFFLFRSSHKFMMTKRFFFIAVSNPPLPFLFFFWWEQAYHFDLCSELLFSYAFVLLKGSKDDGWAKKNWDLNNF